MNYSQNRGGSSFGGRSGYNRNRSFGGGSGRGGGGRGRGRHGDTLDVSLYSQTIDKVALSVIEEKKDFGTFADLNLAPEILESLTARGYLQPTEVQAKSIPIVLDGQDIVTVSHTGSGKTGAFLIPLLNKTTAHAKEGNIQVNLVVAPTRELALQIEKELMTFDLRKLRIGVQTCIGGAPMGSQIRGLSRPNHFIIGTPGRLVDLFNRGVLQLEYVDVVVLDEMDKMLDMGFSDDINLLFSKIPEKHQNLFFSATLDKKVQPTINRLSPNATYIELSQPKPSQFVHQEAIMVNRRDEKMDALFNILKSDNETDLKNKTLVFVNTQIMAEQIAAVLGQNGYVTDFIHGGKTQKHREIALKKFRQTQIDVLVATDVAARGIDVSDISFVVNFDEPMSYEDYIHRIGRTGRNGKFGKAYTLVSR